MMVKCALFAVLLAGTGVSPAIGAAPASRPAPRPSLAPSRPALEQLSNDVQSLYDQVRSQAVRVEMPLPSWIMELAERENPLAKWAPQLNQNVRSALGPGGAVRVGTRPASGRAASTRPSGSQHTSLTIVPMSADGGLALRPSAAGSQPQPLRANVSTLGIVLDGHGHVLVPLYIEREAAAKGPITLYGAQGTITSAHFVASDRQMNLTVLAMDKPIGQPALLDVAKPDYGSLVMILTPNAGTAKLVVWTGGGQEYGIVLGMDGKVDGFVRYGQFLSARTWEPVVQQLITTGIVRRARLGVMITEVRRDDPERAAHSILQEQPAMRVHEVAPDSAADRGGVKPGDLILKIAGQPVGDLPDFASTISQRSGPTELEILRNGHPVKATVDLVPEPAQ